MCGLVEDVAVLLAAAAGEQGHEGEDSGVGGAAEGEWGQGVGGPAEAADDVAGVALDGLE